VGLPPLEGVFVAFHAPPKVGQLLLIVLCMVTARTVAMASNRLFDAEQDQINPRTTRRALPSGNLSRGFVIGVIVACSIGWVVWLARDLARSR